VRAATHTLGSALTDAGDNLRAWSILVGPVVLGCVVVAVALAFRRRAALGLATVPILAILLYGLYWQAGVCYGARFYHAALPALFVAAALGIESLAARDPLPARASRLAAATVAVALLLDASAFRTALHELRSWSFWGTDERFAALRGRWRERPALVMVLFGQDDVRNPPLVATGSAAGDGTWLLSVRALAALAQNGPRLDPAEPVLFAKFHPALVGELAARFPDRELWTYTAWADRRRDVLERWRAADAGPALTAALPRPPDNFDGFRVGPPLSPPDPLLRPTEDAWPPGPPP
jgi:hypothetical protein